MGAREEVEDLLQHVLRSASSSLNIAQEFIPYEYEQVVFKALLEAYYMGEKQAHDKPTIPARDSQTRMPAVPKPLGYPFLDPEETTPVRWPHTKKKPR